MTAAVFYRLRETVLHSTNSNNHALPLLHKPTIVLHGYLRDPFLSFSLSFSSTGVGRAGRDGELAKCLAFLADSDIPALRR